MVELTDAEKEKLRIVRERGKEIDLDFLVKSFCSHMLKEKPDFIVAHVAAFFDIAEEVCINAASQAGADTIHRGISVDRAVDSMRVFMEMSETFHLIGGLLEHALAATETHGEYGLFTPDITHLNKKLEGMRRILIDLKNQHDLEQRRAGRR